MQKRGIIFIAILIVITNILAGCGSLLTTKTVTSTTTVTAAAVPTSNVTTTITVTTTSIVTQTPPSSTSSIINKSPATTLASPVPSIQPTSTPLPVGQYIKILFLIENISNYYISADGLRSKIYIVDTLKRSTTRFLDAKDLSQSNEILIVAGGQFSEAESNLIIEWVKQGGSLLYLVNSSDKERSSANYILQPLADIQINDDRITDPVHFVPEWYNVAELSGITTTLFNSHAVTNNLTKLVFPSNPCSIKMLSDKYTPVVYGEESASSTQYPNKPPLAVLASNNNGRIIVIASKRPIENNYPQTIFDNYAIGKGSNQVFFNNCINWLAHKN